MHGTSEVECTVRRAIADDAEVLARMICMLAHFEGLQNQCNPSVEKLRAQLAPEAAIPLRCLIAESGDVTVGFALYYFSYSTFRTNWGMYLEDIYCIPGTRGVGTALFKQLSVIALEGGHERIDCMVLNWNTRMRQFCRKHGATELAQWIPVRLEVKAT